MNEVKKMEKCIECGSPHLAPDPRTGIFVCQSCKRQYPNSVESFSEEINEISRLRQLREFIKARDLCEEFLKKQPENCEGHWQMVLAELGVVYVQEGEKHKPTFFSYSYDNRNSILDHKNYKNAIQFAPDSASKEYYQIKARELDTLLKEFFLLLKKEKNYDIFISFKQTIQATMADGTTNIFESDDCRKAREIYEHLKDRYNVFFSPVSIGKDTGLQGEKYEPRILKALQSSQAMILVGFSQENLESQWVQNEWRRYKHFIDENKKKKNSLIYVYEKQMHLPLALRNIQLPNVDVYEGKYLEKLDKLLTFVTSNRGLMSRVMSKKLNTNFAEVEVEGFSSTPRTVISIGANSNKTSISIDANEERSIQTANNILEHGRWGDAEKQFKSIIKRSPQSAISHWGLFKAIIKAAGDKFVPLKIINAKPTDYEHLKNAINASSDVQFSWNIIDRLIDGLDHEAGWYAVKEVFNFVTNYVDKKRILKIFEINKKLMLKYLELGKVRISEDIYEATRQLFVEEVKNESIKLMDAYVEGLIANGYYSYATKYCEQLASIRANSSAYIKLLACKLKTTDITLKAVRINPKEVEENTTKKTSELEVDDIIERIIICDNRERKARKSSVDWRIVIPEYCISLDGEYGMIGLTKGIRTRTGVELEDAKEFITKNKLGNIFDTEEEARTHLASLQEININDAEIILTKACKEGVNKTKLVKAVSSAMGTSIKEAEEYILDNELYKKGYPTEEEAKKVSETLTTLGVENECRLNKPDDTTVVDTESTAYIAIREMIIFQVYNARRNVHSLMEMVVSCYRQLEDKEIVKDLMFTIAENLVIVKDFKQAGIWYRELLVDDTNDARAHWGTLKCKLKAVDDYAVQKRYRKLMTYQEFNNAINCADNEQHAHYMRIYENELPPRPKDKRMGKYYGEKSIHNGNSKFNPSVIIKHTTKFLFTAIKEIIGILYYIFLINFAGSSVYHSNNLVKSPILRSVFIVLFAILCFITFVHSCKKISNRKHHSTNAINTIADYNENVRKGSLGLIVLLIAIIVFVLNFALFRFDF